jgi:hypothetical protein
MDEEEIIEGKIAKEDVIDALEEVENEDALSLLLDYYGQLSGAKATAESRVAAARKCAKMLYDAKRYDDIQPFLDDVATAISDDEGPDSEAYALFIEDEELETIRMDATDRTLGAEEEEEDSFDDEDE